MSPEPAHNRGESRQDFETPDEFLIAVLQRFKLQEFAFDFAASEQNTVATCYWDAQVNSLAQDAQHWADMVKQPYDPDGWGWLNSPFAKLAPWVQHSYEASQLGGKILQLVPAGVGSNWWRDWVHRKAYVIFLNGRLQFKGAPDVYPKDCALLVYDKLGHAPDYEVWTWRD